MLTNEIKLIIHEEAELFSSLDPEQKMLSSDVVDYFDRTILNEHRKFREKYVIRIYSDSPVNEKNVEAKIRAYYTQQKDDIDFAVK